MPQPLPMARYPELAHLQWRSRIVGPEHLIVAGSWFMTREIEAAFAHRAHVTFEEDPDYGPTVVWELPVSKTDPQAVGTKRRHAAGGVGAGEAPSIALSVPVAFDFDAPAAKRRKTASKVKQAARDYEAECEARFRASWTESRTPRRPYCGRPASARMADLRARIASKRADDIFAIL